MSEHKAKIVFSDEVWKKIEWFTYNFDTEIGALGRVRQKQEEGEKYFYIDKLFFPEQEVTGATVKFTPGGWGKLVKEHGLDGLSNVTFYWHRHPGYSAHSGTDDEDTFETFMSKKAGRKHFIFLQTAVNSSGVWNQEARIDITSPVRATILDAQIEITVEESPDETKLREECEAIAKDCIVKDAPIKTYKQNRGFGNGKTQQENNNSWDGFEKCVKTNNKKTLDEAVEDGKYGFFEGTDHMNNDMLDGHPTAVDEKVSIDFKHGQCTIKAGKFFGNLIERALGDKVLTTIKRYVRSWKSDKDDGKKKDLITFNLQPVKQQYLELKLAITRAYFVYCDALLRQIEEDESLPEINNETTKDKEKKTAFENYSEIHLEVEGKENVKKMIDSLDEDCIVRWSDVYNAVVCEMANAEEIGHLFLNEEKTKLWANGKGICWVVKTIQDEKDRLYGRDEYEEEE